MRDKELAYFSSYLDITVEIIEKSLLKNKTNHKNKTTHSTPQLIASCFFRIPTVSSLLKAIDNLRHR